MPDYLLDTHTLLWYSQNDPKLPDTLMAVLQQPEANYYISRASLIEIAIKLNIGKLKLLNSFEVWLEKVRLSGLQLLEIRHRHLVTYLHLPQVKDHRDPFDRLLIAQALAEDLTLISRDAKFTDYAVRVLWQ